MSYVYITTTTDEHGVEHVVEENITINEADIRNLNLDEGGIEVTEVFEEDASNQVIAHAVGQGEEQGQELQEAVHEEAQEEQNSHESVTIVTAEDGEMVEEFITNAQEFITTSHDTQVQPTFQDGEMFEEFITNAQEFITTSHDTQVQPTFQVQTMSGSQIPSVIYDMPMNAIMDNRTSVQIVKPRSKNSTSTTGLRPGSGEAPVMLKVVPIASKAVSTNPDVDEITANMLQYQQRARSDDVSVVQNIVRNAQNPNRRSVDILPKMDMNKANTAQILAVTKNSAGSFVTVPSTDSGLQTLSTIPVMTRDSSGELKATMTTLLGPPMSKDAVLYPVDMDQISQIPKGIGKSLVYTTGNKPTIISEGVSVVQRAVESMNSDGGYEVIVQDAHTQDGEGNEVEHGEHEVETSYEEVVGHDGQVMHAIHHGQRIHTIQSLMETSTPQEKFALVKKLKNRIKQRGLGSPPRMKLRDWLEHLLDSDQIPGLNWVDKDEKSSNRIKQRGLGSPPRMKLRDWLEHLLDSDQIPGLNWVDKDEKIFRIPWKHASEGSWNAEDSVVFRLYAIHSGKYPDDGPTTPQLHTKWKANLRCALNSLSDIVLLREISNPRGQKAYRIYKFLDYKVKKDAYKSSSNLDHLVSKAEAHTRRVQDISNFTSQDAGELLIALKHGTRKSKLPAELNIDGIKTIDAIDEVEARGDTNQNEEEQEGVVLIDEYGEGPAVSKEVEIAMQDEAAEVRSIESITGNITDLVKHAMVAIGSSKAEDIGLLCSESEEDEPESATGSQTPDTPIDIVKAEIYFMTQLPETLSPVALKMASSTLEETEYGSEGIIWKSKTQFMFKFESPTGAELWTAMLWCVVCGQCFPSLKSLRHHMSVHQERRVWIDEQLTLVSVKSANNCSDCLVCGLRFSKASSMMKHLLQHSSTFNVTGSAMSVGGNKKCPPCVACGKHFLNMDKLTNHMASHICPICHSTTCDMERHVNKAHSAAGLYQCYICHLYTKTQDEMLHHQQSTHSGIYSVDMIYRVRRPWVTYCTQCYHLIRVITTTQEPITSETDSSQPTQPKDAPTQTKGIKCEDCQKFHCSICDTSFYGYLSFLMHCVIDENSLCVDHVHDVIKESRHQSVYYRGNLSSPDGKDSSTLHQFADVALGELIRKSTPSGDNVKSNKNTDKGKKNLKSPVSEPKARKNIRQNRITMVKNFPGRQSPKKCVTEIIECMQASSQSWITGDGRNPGDVSSGESNVSPSIDIDEGRHPLLRRKKPKVVEDGGESPVSRVTRRSIKEEILAQVAEEEEVEPEVQDLIEEVVMDDNEDSLVIAEAGERPQRTRRPNKRYMSAVDASPTKRPRPAYHSWTKPAPEDFN